MLAKGLSAPAVPAFEEADSTAPDGAATAMPRSMAPGTRVGRFVVQARLGARPHLLADGMESLLGDHDRARRYYEASLEVRLRQFGPRSPNRREYRWP
jgi:hypothetical protein